MKNHENHTSPNWNPQGQLEADCLLEMLTMGNKKGCSEGIWYEVVISYQKNAEYYTMWNSER